MSRVTVVMDIPEDDKSSKRMYRRRGVFHTYSTYATHAIYNPKSNYEFPGELSTMCGQSKTRKLKRT